MPCHLQDKLYREWGEKAAWEGDYNIPWEGDYVPIIWFWASNIAPPPPNLASSYNIVATGTCT